MENSISLCLVGKIKTCPNSEECGHGLPEREQASVTQESQERHGDGITYVRRADTYSMNSRG